MKKTFTLILPSNSLAMLICTVVTCSGLSVNGLFPQSITLPTSCKTVKRGLDTLLYALLTGAQSTSRAPLGAISRTNKDGKQMPKHKGQLTIGQRHILGASNA